MWSWAGRRVCRERGRERRGWGLGRTTAAGPRASFIRRRGHPGTGRAQRLSGRRPCRVRWWPGSSALARAVRKRAGAQATVRARTRPADDRFCRLPTLAACGAHMTDERSRRPALHRTRPSWLAGERHSASAPLHRSPLRRARAPSQPWRTALVVLGRRRHPRRDLRRPLLPQYARRQRSGRSADASPSVAAAKCQMWSPQRGQRRSLTQAQEAPPAGRLAHPMPTPCCTAALQRCSGAAVRRRCAVRAARGHMEKLGRARRLGQMAGPSLSRTDFGRLIADPSRLLPPTPPPLRSYETSPFRRARTWVTGARLPCVTRTS